MEFLILGPLEVREDGRTLPLGGLKQRALLATLLLHAGEVVASDRLIEELWNGAPRRDGGKALSMAVARLRATLEPGVIVTSPPGYAVHVEPGRLDLRRFEELVAAGRAARDPAVRGPKLREALALWRGPPLADLTYESFCAPEIARLEELRISVLEDGVDAELALGHGAGLVAELEALVHEHPLRERLRGQLMLALYRSGRQADALEAYMAGRSALVDELGIEPGRALRELHQAILEQDAGLEPERRERIGTEPQRRVFVGRGRELAELVAGLDDAFAGRGRLFLVAGEPGIGKSRLGEELIRHANGRGARVLIGRCWEAGGAPAYWPWIHALRAYVRDCDPATLRAQAGSGGGALAQVIPEIGDLVPGLTTPAVLEPAQARFQLFDSTAQFLRAAAEPRPILLVLDDLHAADPASLLLLRFVARELGTGRLLVFAAYRDVDPLPGEPLTEMLADVAREPGSRRIVLGGLAEPEVAEYVELTAKDLASPQLAAALLEQTEGNPLFVGEIVRLLHDRSAGAKLAIPPSIRDVISRRLALLEPECRRLLVLASVLGREFPLDVLAGLGGVSRDELLGSLDAAIAARIVTDDPGSPGRLRFDHVLFRDALYEGLTSARRMRLHALAVAALEDLGSPAELASHALAAGEPAKALGYARDAARGALERHAYEEAARLFGLALEAFDLLPDTDPAARHALLMAMGDALAWAGSTAESKQRFLAAAGLARSELRPDALAAAALGYGGATIWQRAGDDDRLVPLLEEALEAVGTGADARLRARLLARLAGALRDRPSLEPRVSLSREAVDLARATGDDDTLAMALVAHFLASWGPDIEPLVAIADELRGLAQAPGTPVAVLDALTVDSILAWLTLADSDAASLDDLYASIAAELGQPSDLWQAAMQDVLWALLHGDFAKAEQLAAHALSRGDARRSDADCSYRLAMFVLRRDQGRLAEVEELTREAVEAYPGYRSFRCFIPLLEVELGREAEARRQFEALASGDFGSLPRDCEWLFCLATLAEVAARLGDRANAEVLYRLLLPYPRINVTAAGEVAIGPVARFLGILAMTVSRPAEAAAHFEDAIAMIERMGSRPLLARTYDDYGHMLLARGDEQRAHTLLAACDETYRDLGMVPLKRPGGPAPRPRPAGA